MMPFVSCTLAGETSIASGMPTACSDLAFYGWVMTFIWLIYESLAGGYMGAQAALVLGLLKARYSYLEGLHMGRTELVAARIYD